MKKIISTIMALTMMIGVMATLGTAVSATAAKTAEPYIKGSAVTVTAYTSNGVIDGNDSANIVPDGGKLTITRKAETLAKNTGVEARFDAVDASGKQFMQFWLDTSEASGSNITKIGFRVFASDGSAGDIFVSNGKVNYYIQVNNKWVKYTVASDSCVIPAGYAGYVRIDLDQFGSNVPAYCGNGNPLSDDKINGYNLWFFPNDAQVGNPIVVSDVKFVNDDKANTTYSHKQGKQPKIIGEAVNFSGYKSTSPLEAADCEVTFEGDLIKILRKTEPNGKNDGTELYTDEVNATGKQFIEFWVDTIDASVVNGTSLGMRVFAPDASGGWTAADIMAANGTDYYYLVNGVWLKGNVAGSVISLPAGFAGYVRVDLVQLSANLPAYCGNGKDLLDFSKIKGVWLWCTPTAERVNKTVYINSIRFVNADNSPEVEEKNADTSDAMLGVSVVCAVAVCGVVFTAKKRKK